MYASVFVYICVLSVDQKINEPLMYKMAYQGCL